MPVDNCYQVAIGREVCIGAKLTVSQIQGLLTGDTLIIYGSL